VWERVSASHAASSRPTRRSENPRVPGRPTDEGEFVQVHDDREVFQASPDELPAIDIHSLWGLAARRAG
jgi:hypothetical protein